MGKRELIALLNLSSWCRVMVKRLFLTVPRGCLQFVIVVFPDHTHLLFLGLRGASENKLKDTSFIFAMTNVTILCVFRTHAQKEKAKVWEIRGTPTLNILTLLLFENYTCSKVFTQRLI